YYLFFHVPTTTQSLTLSLHDALPICYGWIEEQFAAHPSALNVFVLHHHLLPIPGTGRERNVVYDAGDAIECLQRAGVHLVLSGRSEEHTSELQSRGHLVCRLLLEKKK